jgi:hypothetical protein
MKTKLFLNSVCVLGLGLLGQNLAQADRWNSANDPSIMAPDYEYRLDAFPLKAMLSPNKMPWSETYWPSKKGSINLRWNQENPEGFKTKSPSREQVLKMSRDQLAKLSPSEKYDIFMGRYDYPLKDEAEGIATPYAKWWSGICDGWAPIALQFAEPKPVDMANPDGVMVPFGSSDLKGIMSFYGARHVEYNPKQVGLKCNGFTRILGTASCQDLNPGAMHVILGNQIALRNEGFVMEKDPGPQIWNQPVYGYNSDIVGSAKTSTRAATSAVRVSTTVYYADELDESQWEPVTGTSSFMVGKLNLSYTLDLDASGRIIGGDWISDEHPDFFWLPTEKAVFKDYFEGVNRLYQPVEPSAKIPE